MGFQTCRVCKEEKPLTEYTYRKDSGKYRTECKPCRSRTSQASRYGISVGEIEELIEQTGNRCMICDTHADDVPHTAFRYNPLVVDHDHVTGKVRGLLCPTCNAGLGHFQDNKTLLINAVRYLERN